MTSASVVPTNEDVAEVLDRVAGLLEAQRANRFRVGAYKKASEAEREGIGYS